MAVSKNFSRLSCIAFVTFYLLAGIFGSAPEEEDTPEVLTPKFVELKDLSIEEFCEGCKEFVGEIDKQLDDPVTRTDKELTVYLNEVCEELEGWASSKALKVCNSIMSVGGAQDNLHSILKAATDSSPKMICHDLFNVCHKKDPSFKNTTLGLQASEERKDGMREISQEEYAEMQASEGFAAGGQNGTSKPQAVSVNEYCEGCKLLMQEVNNQLDIVETRTLKEVEAYLRELCEDVEGWFPPSVAEVCRAIVPSQTLTISGLIQMKVKNLEESVCRHFLKACPEDDEDFKTNETDTANEADLKNDADEAGKKRKKKGKKKSKKSREPGDTDHVDVQQIKEDL